jgi:hypothetical protein
VSEWEKYGMNGILKYGECWEESFHLSGSTGEVEVGVYLTGHSTRGEL